MNLENRSTCTENEVLARASVQTYLKGIRQIWLFLQIQGRVTTTYYSELKEMFRLDDNSLILPGRAAQVIDSLSEAEEAAIFAAIERYSTNSILKLRDAALFITGLQTTMRMDSLNSMRVENFRELEPGIWVCRVRAKRSAKKAASSMDRLAEDKAEWRDWYISPYSYAAINTYLEITSRNWQSQGPVWLSQNGQPLTLNAQEDLIRKWLRVAGCKFVRPHVLRHTGLDRLINKFNLPIPIVQAVSQHADPNILLKVYAKRARVDAFKDINQLFPAEEGNVTAKKQLVGSGLAPIQAVWLFVSSY